MRYKRCAVLECTNTSVKTPEKLFVTAPANIKVRRKWLQLARRDNDDISPRTILFFCEDHFDLEKDMANYHQHKMGFSRKILIKDGVMPSKFNCQQDQRKSICNAETSRPAYAKRQRNMLIELCEGEDIQLSQPVDEPLIKNGMENLTIVHMMDTLTNHICSVCFSTDRKIMVLNDSNKKQYFLRFCEISAVQAWHDDVPIQLCWECDALLRRFIKFKIKAQNSLVNLKKYANKHLGIIKTSLQINKQFSINLYPNETQTVDTYSEVVKVEDNETLVIKEECDTSSIHDDSDNYSEDDDKTLIELSNRINKQLNNCKKKRQKKEAHIDDSEIKKEVQYYIEKELTSQEIEEERRCLQLREDYVNAVFRCERCILSFPNAEDMKDHISIKHEVDTKQWICSWCECTLGSQVAFNYHISKHTRRYVCVVCGENARSKRAAQRHYETTHMTRPDLVYNELHENGVEKDHTLEINGTDSTKEDIPTFQCELCDKSFRWKTSLRKHLETHRIETGQKRRPYCETCRLSFTTTSNLQKHVKTSSKHQIQLKLRKLKEDCTLPDKDKEQSKIEQIRCSVNSKRQVFPCAQCDRRFQWRGNLLRHLHSHRAKANGELVCEPCNRTFSSIATYNQHMKISRKHVSENDFKYMCSDCGKKFANKTRLKDHVDWEHLKNYVHKCPVCQKVFKSHTSLYLHKQVVHKKNNPEHLCDHCGKPFPNRAKLRNHIVAIHTTEAPYACNTCNARFSWHSCLSRHVRRVHKGKQSETGLQIGTQ